MGSTLAFSIHLLELERGKENKGWIRAHTPLYAIVFRAKSVNH